MSTSRKSPQFKSRGSRPKRALGRWVVAALAAALVLLVAGIGPARESSAAGNPAPVGGPGFRWSAWGSSQTIVLGESLELNFLVHNVSYDADHGGISVSFPDLTRSGAGSTSYSSSQGSVRTIDYTTGRSRVSYFEKGDQIWNSRGEQQSADHLLVESDDPSWPTTADRILRLEVTPKRTGRFRVYYRIWICGDGYSDCSRAPTGRDVYGLDQQGWAAGAFNIQVEEPEEENSPPSVTAVSPLQSLTINVGDSVTFRARATDDDDNISQVDWYVNRSWASGQSLSQTGRTEQTYTERFSSGGTHRIEVEFTDTDGESDSVVWEVYAIEPPSVDSLGCNDSRVQVGETVNCSPRLSGGSPTSYLWGSIGGNPWNGTSRSFSTQWDSPGQKRIVFEACNNDGCDSGEHNVVVDPRPLNPPTIDRLGCNESRVEVGETVSCSPRLSGGSPTSYLWGSIGGNPWNGTSRSFSTQWDSPGQKKIVFEACNNDGCDSGEHNVVVDRRPLNPPTIDSMGCNDSRAEVGETVSCSPRLSGGNPTRYLWGSREGTPWSGTSRSFSTRWDSPGRKQIVFEACNNDGCDISEHWVEVAARPLNPPTIDRLGCSDSRVETGETVSCSPGLSGGSPTSYLWGSIGGTPWNGTSRTFSTHWDSPGRKQIVFEVCNNDGCDSGEHNVVVDRRTLNPPSVDSLGCNSSRVGVGETVSCSPRLSGGSPARYLWGSREGTPWSGTSRTFSTRWDSSGRKQIAFEACNNDGCSIGEHWVDVVQQVDPPPIIHALNCSSPSAMTGETVSCRASLGGGSPSRYQWRTQGGSPSSGNSSNFSTHWDSPGTKRISLEVCNDGGCVSRQQDVVVAREIQAAIRVTTAGAVTPGSSITVAGSGFPRFRPVDNVRIGGRAVQQQARPSTDINGQFSVRITVPQLSPGTHAVMAEVYGKTARTSIRVVAAPSPNRAPVVSPVSPLASQRITVGTSQQFTVQANDPDGNLTRVEWSVNGQSRGEKPLNSVRSARETLDYRVPLVGNYRLTVTFTDAEGASDSAEWQFEGVTVGQPPQGPPQVTNLGCSPVTVLIGEPVTCKPHLSAGDVSRYRWKAIGGESSWGTGTTLSTSWSTEGQKEIELEVCNSAGECDSGGQTIRVEAARSAGPQIQSLGCSPSGVEVGEFVFCHPQIATEGPVEYTWRAVGGLPSSGEGRSFRTRWRSGGPWEITLTVCSDEDCSSGSALGSISQTLGPNRAPVAARVSPSSPVTLRAGQAQTFAARAIDSEGNLHAAGWLVSRWYTPANIGFSSIGTSPQRFTHVFNSPGSYRVSLIYYDSHWEEAIVEWEVTVVEDPERESSDEIIVIPLPKLESFRESLAALNELKGDWLECVQDNPGNEQRCRDELVGAATAMSATANLSSIFDQYRERGFAEDFIRDVELVLITAGLSAQDVGKAALLILEGAVCGQFCFEMDIPGSDDPWYLVGWLIAGAIPVVDIATDGRDFLVSTGTCLAHLFSLEECDWLDYGVNLGGLVFSVVPIGGQIANAAQAGVHIVKFAVKRPTKTGTVLRHAKRIPLAGTAFDGGVRWASNTFMKNSISRTKLVGAFMGEKAGTFSGVTIKRNLETHIKVADVHHSFGTKSSGKSLFDNFTDIARLIDDASLVHPRHQKAGFGHSAGLQWIVDAGERIGMGRVAGQYFPTSIYTVITDFDGLVRTAHPGIPDLPVKVGSRYKPKS